MLLDSSRNCRLEVNRFSVTTTSGTVSVNRRNALCNMPGLTAPGSLNTCPMCEEQWLIFNVPTVLLWYTVLLVWAVTRKTQKFRIESLVSIRLGLPVLDLKKKRDWQHKALPTAPPGQPPTTQHYKDACLAVNYIFNTITFCGRSVSICRTSINNLHIGYFLWSLNRWSLLPWDSKQLSHTTLKSLHL